MTSLTGCLVKHIIINVFINVKQHSFSFYPHALAGRNERGNIMPAYYDEKAKIWYCIFYYTDWMGAKKQKKKRGFERKKDALEWERIFLLRQSTEPTMPFSTLCTLYLEDKRHTVSL